jgi:hypothetical protein
MGLKEWWEKHQMAVAFAEAGEEGTAREILNEEIPNDHGDRKGEHLSNAAGSGSLRPNLAEG